MRVVAGRWRGHPLRTLPDRRVRPTTDRVREALFSMLGAAVDGAQAADLCCGSGALGIEALSRGARHVTFVDVAPAALAVARANLERLGAPPASWALVRADAVAWLARRLERDEPLVVLADPPYDEPLAARLLAALDATAAVPVAVIEHAAGAAPPAPAGPWRVDRRRYGRSGLTVLWREAP